MWLFDLVRGKLAGFFKRVINVYFIRKKYFNININAVTYYFEIDLRQLSGGKLC